MKLYPEHRKTIYLSHLAGQGNQSLADKFGVSRSTIRNIILRESGAKPRVKPIKAQPPEGYTLKERSRIVPPLQTLLEDWIRTRRVI